MCHSAKGGKAYEVPVAGTSTILLLWGALTAVSYFFEYWLQTGGSDAAEQSPWVRAPFYGAFIAVGVVGGPLSSARLGPLVVDPRHQPVFGGDQVVLVLHHLFDRFVRPWGLIDELPGPVGFPCLSLHRLGQLFGCE